MSQELIVTMDEFSEKQGLYADFTSKLEGLLQEMLKQKGIRIHSITSRVKDKDSLRKKIERSDGKYSALDQITDLVGIRIITYFEDEVDAIANIVEEEFQIDALNSVDKRGMLDPDRFGYLSLHYVVQLSDQRCALTEYTRFQDCKAEIQIRSILQHTWAEIEHDLGYKSKQAIPKDIRRSFSRLAGLLEIADLEFAKIRDSLQKYEEEVPKQITEAPAEVLIDQTSLKSYISSSPLLHSLDLDLAKMAGLQITTVAFDDYIGRMVERLHYLGFMTISDVGRALQENRDLLLRFAECVFQYKNIGVVQMGLTLFYLCFVLVAKRGSLQEILQYLHATAVGNVMERVDMAREIAVFYHQASQHNS